MGAIEAGSTISINYEFIELAQELFGIEEINIEIPRFELAVTDIHMGYHLKAGMTAGFVIDLNGNPANIVCGCDFNDDSVFSAY